MDVSKDSICILIFTTALVMSNVRTHAQSLRRLSWAHSKTTLASLSVTSDHVETGVALILSPEGIFKGQLFSIRTFRRSRWTVFRLLCPGERGERVKQLRQLKLNIEHFHDRPGS